MPLTVEQIIEETRQWPREKVGQLVSALSEGFQDAGVDNAWKSEVRRRLADIESGRVQVVDGDSVSMRIRQMVGR